MATFRYARTDGSLGTLEADNADSALGLLPGDAAKGSGVQSMLSGTGSPSPSQEPTLPQGGGGGAILTFAESLDRAVNLARQNRNKQSLDLMGPYRGTAAASDFNSILGNLNKASDTTSADLIKRATESPDASDIFTTTNDAGVVTGIDRATGNILWQTKPGVGNQQGGDGGGTVLKGGKSGNLVYSPADIIQSNQILKQSSLAGPEADGKYADPNEYLSMYKYWVENEGNGADFIKLYPIEKWINPDNDWLTDAISEFNKEFEGSGRSA